MPQHFTYFRFSVYAVVALLMLGLRSATADKPTETLKILLPRITSVDQVEQTEAREALQQHCFRLGSPGNEKLRSAACIEMITALSGDLDRSTKLFLLRQIERIGSDESVVGLRQLIGGDDPVISDAARRALANNPSSKATDVLQALLAEADKPESQVQLIHALSFRKRSHDPQLFDKLLQSKDANVVAACADALARIASDEAVKLLVKRLESPKVDDSVAGSAVKLATKLRVQGKTASAQELFDSVLEADVRNSIRAAAVRGSLSCLDSGAGKKLLALLKGSNKDLIEIAVAYVAQLDHSEVQVLIEGATTLPAETGSRLFVALAARRHPSSISLFTSVAKSTVDSSLRAVAIESLGKVCNAQSVPYLLTLLSNGDQVVSAASESALATIRDEKANTQILRALDAAPDVAQRATLINILDRRRSPELVNLIMHDLDDDDQQVRRRAVGILSRLGGPQHVAGALHRVHAVPGNEFNQYSNAIVAICKRIPSEDTQAKPVIAVYSSSSPSARGRILSIAGAIGGKEASDFIEGKLNSASNSEVESAVAALANWPDASVAQTLLEIARSGDTESQRIRAIRGIARVVVLPNSPLSELEQLEMLRQAMRLTTRLDERKLILDRVKAIDLIEAVRFVRPYLNDDSLREVACKSIAQIGRIKSLRTEYPELIGDLKRVIKIAEDQKVRQRAQVSLLDDSP